MPLQAPSSSTLDPAPSPKPFESLPNLLLCNRKSIVVCFTECPSRNYKRDSITKHFLRRLHGRASEGTMAIRSRHFKGKSKRLIPHVNRRNGWSQVEEIAPGTWHPALYTTEPAPLPARAGHWGLGQTACSTSLPMRPPQLLPAPSQIAPAQRYFKLVPAKIRRLLGFLFERDSECMQDGFFASPRQRFVDIVDHRLDMAHRIKFGRSHH